jgi:hypothetical protein
VLKLFQLKAKSEIIRVNSNEQFAIINYKNGKTEKREFYYGSSFLSQSSRFIRTNKNMSAIVIYDNKGKQREIML